VVSRIAPAAALTSFAWVALLVAAPVLSAPLAAILYAAGAFLCHQLPERSFYLGGFQLPVCARCLGLYGGAALGTLAAACAGWAFAAREAAAPGKVTTYIATVIAALPTMATVIVERGIGWPVSNSARAAAAVPLAAVVAFVVMRAAATLHYDQCAPRRPIGHGQPPANT
jgi:uncharacterized membrane protein